MGLFAQKKYAIQIWKDDVKHIKICVKTRTDLNCLKGVDIDCGHKCDHEKCDKCDEHKITLGLEEE